MPCYHPLNAWRSQTGEITIGKDAADSHQLRLPCGGCLGCRMARAQEWTLRCKLERQQHAATVFTTLTYDESHLPATLDRRHVQLFLKRLRKRSDRPIRFFASGEYGEQNERPHYHALLFGLAETDDSLVDSAWGMGYTRTVNVTPAAIAYVAGYSAKKIGYKDRALDERVDPNTGEVYHWQPPFIEMSRRPGIAAHARQWPDSWRNEAILDGHHMPVPRYLHNAWQDQATPEQKEQLEIEKIKKAILRDTSTERIKAAEQIAIAKQKRQGEKRKL